MQLGYNRLATIPREIGRLRALTHLYVSHNLRLANVDHSPAVRKQTGRAASRDRPAGRPQGAPRKLPPLLSLVSPALAQLHDNELTSLPAELGQLSSLEYLYVRSRLCGDTLT